MARNIYIYFENNSNSNVTVYPVDHACSDGVTPDPANIKSHHKQTIIVKTGGDFVCNFKATKVDFNIAVRDYGGLYDRPEFQFYKGAGKDPHLSITYDPLHNLEVINSTTIRIKNY